MTFHPCCLRCGEKREKGRSKWCASCALVVLREQQRAHAKDYYHRNRERCLAKRAEYVEAHREELRAYWRERYRRQKAA